GVAAWPFFRSPSQIVEAIRGGFTRGDQELDLLLLLLISACFVPYVSPPFRGPGYFFGGFFFFSALTGRFLAPCFASFSTMLRFFQHAASLRRSRNLCHGGNYGSCGDVRHSAPQSNRNIDAMRSGRKLLFDAGARRRSGRHRTSPETKRRNRRVDHCFVRL